MLLAVVLVSMITMGPWLPITYRRATPLLTKVGRLLLPWFRKALKFKCQSITVNTKKSMTDLSIFGIKKWVELNRSKW